ELVNVDLVVGGECSRRPRVGGTDVDEGHMCGFGAERLAHHGEPRLRMCHNRSFARLDAGFEEWHRACEVLVLRLVDEGVVPECCAVRAHRSSIQASCYVSARLPISRQAVVSSRSYSDGGGSGERCAQIARRTGFAL